MRAVKMGNAPKYTERQIEFLAQHLEALGLPTRISRRVYAMEGDMATYDGPRRLPRMNQNDPTSVFSSSSVPFIAQLLTLDESDLYDIPLISAKSVETIIDALHMKGYDRGDLKPYRAELAKAKTPEDMKQAFADLNLVKPDVGKGQTWLFERLPYGLQNGLVSVFSESVLNNERVQTAVLNDPAVQSAILDNPAVQSAIRAALKTEAVQGVMKSVSAPSVKQP